MLEKLRRLFTPEPTPPVKNQNVYHDTDEHGYRYIEVHDRIANTFPNKAGVIYRISREGVDEVYTGDVPKNVNIYIRFKGS